MGLGKARKHGINSDKDQKLTEKPNRQWSLGTILNTLRMFKPFETNIEEDLKY